MGTMYQSLARPTKVRAILANFPISMWFSTWGGVTDPSQHDPKNFRYLVHSFKPCSKLHMEIMFLENVLYRKDSGKHPYIDSVHGDQKINLMQQPERLSERVSLSMSLIDPEKPSTFGAAGIIVAAPETNVLATSPDDMGSMNSDPEFLREQAAEKGKLCGNELLNVTKRNFYNEVVALAKVGGNTLKLEGFFYKTENGNFLNEILAERMQQNAKRLGLPIIAIEEARKYKRQDGVIAGNDKLAVHLSGKIFLLSGWDRQNFQCVDENKKINFIDPKQFSQVVEFLEAKKVDKKTILDLSDQYSLISKQKHKYVTFNDNDNTRYK